MRLTIAIPTYNRNEILCESLRHLLPQLNNECQLLILDDHSDEPVEDTLRDLLASYPDVHYRIVRNKFNVGLGANILRCFELCESPWMWLSGDDDHAMPDAISVILRHLDEHPSCCFINFVGPRFHRTATRTTVGLEDFIDKLDNWGNMLFMSVGVYHCPTLTPQLRMAYHYMYSYGPHIALLLASLQEGGRSVLSDKRIVDHQSPPGWAPVVLLLGKMSLLEMPMRDAERRTFARKLREKPSLEAIVTMLLHAARKEGASQQALYQYDQICSRCYYYDRSWLLWMRMFCYRLLLKFHRFGFPALALTYPALSRMSGKGHVKFNDVCPPDTYKRL